MELEERKKLYERAIASWGINAQVDMVFEECGELVAVLAKDRRGRVSKEEILTELADVTIMCEQLATVLGYDDFETEKERKLERLGQRLDKYNGKG